MFNFSYFSCVLLLRSAVESDSLCHKELSKSDQQTDRKKDRQNEFWNVQHVGPRRPALGQADLAVDPDLLLLQN